MSEGDDLVTTILIILAIQLTYVSFFTVRMILTFKGLKYYAAMISMFEVGIYISGLHLVLNDLGQWQNLAAYCVGYGLGVLMGSKIEEWLALGYITVMVITQRANHYLPELLRMQGYGVTSWIAEGRDGERTVMQILTKRKNQTRLYDFVSQHDKGAFLMTHEARHFKGGFWTKVTKK